MLALLDETDQRRIFILEVLMEQLGWITIGELAQRVFASERTIQTDLVFFKNAWGDRLNLDVSQKHGVRLLCRSYATLHALSIEIVKNAVAPRLICDLFLFPDQSMEFYTNKLFTSKSTLLRQIPKINAYLSRMNVFIERGSAGLHLFSPDEHSLRKLIASSYVELNPGLTNQQCATTALAVPFAVDLVDFSKLCDLVRAVLLRAKDADAASLALSDPSILPEMTAFYLVSLVREQQGFHAESTRMETAPVSPDELHSVQKIFPSIRETQLLLIHEVLTEPFLALGADAIALLRRESAAFYARVFSALHVSCPPQTQEKLSCSLEVLYRYALVRPIRAAGMIRRVSGFSSSLRVCHPKLYAAFQESLAVFSGAMQLDLMPNLPDLILRACYLFPALAMAAPTRKLLVVSDSGQDHAEFVANFVRALFNGTHYQTIVIQTIPYEEALHADLDARYPEEEILITTDPALLSLQTRKTVLLFHDFPSTENFGQLYDVIYRS